MPRENIFENNPHFGNPAEICSFEDKPASFEIWTDPVVFQALQLSMQNHIDEQEQRDLDLALLLSRESISENNLDVKCEPVEHSSEDNNRDNNVETEHDGLNEPPSIKVEPSCSISDGTFGVQELSRPGIVTSWVAFTNMSLVVLLCIYNFSLIGVKQHFLFIGLFL